MSAETGASPEPEPEPEPEPARTPRRSRSAPTIYDIAKAADVSPSTVSRALNKPGRINFKTEQRVQAAAKELNYRHNPMARALPTGRMQTLGLLIADITNPMFFNVVRGAQREAFQRGYTLVLADSQESDLREAEAAERVAPFVDGLILVTTRLNDDQIRKLAEWKPLVVINRKVDGVDGVLPDITPGVDEALVHLSGLGHQSLAFLSGPANSWMSRARRETLFRNAPEHGMAIVEIGPGVPTLEGGREVLTQVLASGATAVLAYNDLMAIGLMRAAQQHGLVVPDRLSIIGFDDIFGSDFTSPPLSTIRTPLDRIGERAVWRALELVEGREGSPPPERHELALATELVVRGSTGLASRVFI